MKSILVVLEIEPKTGAVWARTEDLKDTLCSGVGDTEAEALADLQTCMDLVAETRKEDGRPIPEWYSKKAKFIVRYDIGYFFEMFPFINASEFGKAVGINPSLMRQYKIRTNFPSAKQRAKIQKGLNDIISRMQGVRL